MAYIDASGAITDEEKRRGRRGRSSSRTTDYVDQARQNMQAQLSRSSYFPAANLSQFEGTELAPPGGGTYYNPSRYSGLHDAGLQRRAQQSLANAWQSDLAFNVQANPRMAAGLQAERIGAQYGGGQSFAGRPGYTTVYTPSGGSAVVSDAVAKRMVGKNAGYSIAPMTPKPPTAYSASGRPAQTGMTIYHPPESYGIMEPQRWEPFNRAVSQPLLNAARDVSAIPRMAYNALSPLAQTVYNWASNALNQPNKQQQQSQNYYAYNPSPLPQQPRRYFDF